MDEPVQAPATEEPWLRFPLLWMVMALPAAVVVAGFVTLWLALRTPDPLVTSNRAHLGPGRVKESGGMMRMPAMAGRNHAATPAGDLPNSRR